MNMPNNTADLIVPNFKFAKNKYMNSISNQILQFKGLLKVFFCVILTTFSQTTNMQNMPTQLTLTRGI